MLAARVSKSDSVGANFSIGNIFAGHLRHGFHCWLHRVSRARHQVLNPVGNEGKSFCCEDSAAKIDPGPSLARKSGKCPVYLRRLRQESEPFANTIYPV